MRTHFLSTLSHLERVVHRHDNLYLHTRSSTHGKGDGSNKNWTWKNGIDRTICRKPAGKATARVTTTTKSGMGSVGVRKRYKYSPYYFCL
jgi:hypothetical protein